MNFKLAENRIEIFLEQVHSEYPILNTLVFAYILINRIE
jgi:hypothetical protein